MSGGSADLFRALAVLAEPPEPGHAAVADALGLPGVPTAADYTEVFLLEVYPYASIYLGPEGMMGGEARDRVAGFWRALGLVPPTEPDHLGMLLGLYAALIDLEPGEDNPARATARRSARRALLWEHLLSWTPPFLDKVASRDHEIYTAWAETTSRVLVGEANELGTQNEAPLAFRQAQELPDPGERAADWVAALLAPSRSGMILARSDLGLAARELGVGLRVGERAFILKALLEQDPEGTTAWLAEQASGAADRHGSWDPVLADVASFWRGRARSTAAALKQIEVSEAG